jgi:hypothetical protein
MRGPIACLRAAQAGERGVDAVAVEDVALVAFGLSMAHEPDEGAGRRMTSSTTSFFCDWPLFYPSGNFSACAFFPFHISLIGLGLI